jgi:hypothetical protein
MIAGRNADTVSKRCCIQLCRSCYSILKAVELDEVADEEMGGVGWRLERGASLDPGLQGAFTLQYRDYLCCSAAFSSLHIHHYSRIQ